MAYMFGEKIVKEEINMATTAEIDRLQFLLESYKKASDKKNVNERVMALYLNGDISLNVYNAFNLMTTNKKEKAKKNKIGIGCASDEKDNNGSSSSTCSNNNSRSC